MASKIVLIRRGSAFMVNAIVGNLQKSGFDIIECDASVAEFKVHKDDAGLYLFYMGNYIDEVSDFLVYLKDICIENEKQLIVIGSREEMDIASKNLPTGVVSEFLERPLNMEKLLLVLENAFEKNRARDQKKHILLVDDDANFLQMMKGWLDMEYRVTVVGSGMQAITYIANHRPDLILLDYEMPVTTGPQVLEMLKSEPNSRDIPVIFLTGKGDKESVMKVLALKPAGYLLKTMSREDILTSVSNFFEEQKGRKQ